MLVAGLVSECDFSDTTYSASVQGAHLFAQGATGRWCVVMYVGPEYIRANNLEDTILTIEQAERQVELKGGYLDF